MISTYKTERTRRNYTSIIDHAVGLSFLIFFREKKIQSDVDKLQHTKKDITSLFSFFITGGARSR